MPTFPLPTGAIPADLPQRLRLQLASSSSAPPDGDGWLHEVKHDGHRLVAIVAGDTIKLLSRNARDRTELFAEPFRGLAAAGLPRRNRQRPPAYTRDRQRPSTCDCTGRAEPPYLLFGYAGSSGDRSSPAGRSADRRDSGKRNRRAIS